MTEQRWERYFALFVEAHDLPLPEREVKFHPRRKWRFDLAWREQRVAVEVEGGAWTNGRHVRGAGYLSDCEKYNQAQLMGWIVLRFCPDQVMSGECFPTIKQALERRLT
jgi:very-short-patch-repair endonuclease